MPDNLPSTVHIAIAEALESGQLHLVKNNQYQIQKYDHKKRVYSTGSMWLPIEWKNLVGVFLAEAAGVILYDDGG